jgi:murein DD-endopeptidase MepM/ murein hydrolase activator NlpD
MRPLLLLLLLFGALPARGHDLQLALPLDCEIGRDCFIEDYVDHDPAPGRQRDFACGFNARDGHRGTDFALISFAAMERGVTVRAAAAGRVLRIRDAMPDDRLMRGVTEANACGNAVLIDHGDG